MADAVVGDGIAVLADQLVRELAARHVTVATCESLTGGLIGAAITSIGGSSAVYRGGFITYASELKSQWAGVDAELIARDGVINAATAEQMAQGTRVAAGADLCVSCTGVAGPDPQDGAAPGTVWIACATAGGTRSSLLELSGNRGAVREQTVLAALRLLLEELD